MSVFFYWTQSLLSKNNIWNIWNMCKPLVKITNKLFKNDYIILSVLWTQHEGEKYEWFWNSDFSKSQSTLKPFTSPWLVKLIPATKAAAAFWCMMHVLRESNTEDILKQ